MFTVALVGPDGAGKSTVTKQIEGMFPLPIKYVYMGVNLDTSNLVLPTTRLILEIKRAGGGKPDFSGPPDPDKKRDHPKGSFKRILSVLKSNFRMVNLMAEEWFRQAVVWSYMRRGYIVIFDRHFFTDYYAHDIASVGEKRPFVNRLHGFMLRHLYPRPDFVICLDAPAESLYQRKREGSVELLEHRRQEYLKLKDVFEHFVVVDATQPQEKVVEQVADLIWDFYNARHDNVIKVDWKKWAS